VVSCPDGSVRINLQFIYTTQLQQKVGILPPNRKRHARQLSVLRDERLRDELLENRKDGAPEIQPQSLGHPSLWRGRFEPIRLIHVGWEARKAPVDAVVFSLDFPFYRIYQELAFRVCDHHGFAE